MFMFKTLDHFKEDFKQLTSSQQQLLRHIARERLKDFSYEETGSSDISNEMMSMYKSYGYNLHAILEDYADTYSFF